MKRREFVAGFGVILAAPLAAEGQSPPPPRPDKTRPLVGYLGSGHPSDRTSPLFSYLFQSFAKGLRDVGYVDGETVTIEWRFAEEKYERLPGLAAELVRRGVNVIFAPSDHTAVAARQATRTIPIVFSSSADPVGSGFADSLSRPGRNMTGLTLPGPEVTAKRLGLLKEAIGNASDCPSRSHHVRVVTTATFTHRPACLHSASGSIRTLMGPKIGSGRPVRRIGRSAGW
jgi:ABC transporter substrate binding protein